MRLLTTGSPPPPRGIRKRHCSCACAVGRQQASRAEAARAPATRRGEIKADKLGIGAGGPGTKTKAQLTFARNGIGFQAADLPTIQRQARSRWPVGARDLDPETVESWISRQTDSDFAQYISRPRHLKG